jgi:hypothetical protein
MAAVLPTLGLHGDAPGLPCDPQGDVGATVGVFVFGAPAQGYLLRNHGFGCKLGAGDLDCRS